MNNKRNRFNVGTIVSTSAYGFASYGHTLDRFFIIFCAMHITRVSMVITI